MSLILLIILRYIGCWNREVPLYTEVSSFQGVGIEEFHCIQKVFSFQGVGLEGFYSMH